MSEVDNQESGELGQGELESLKARADMLGIKYHPSISVDTLRERVNAKLLGDVEVAERPGKESEAAHRERKQKEAAALVRVRIHCNDPAKKEWPGEVITVGNSVAGTFKKYIPYNQDEPYHIPQIILNALREKRVQVFTTKKGKMGIPIRESKSISAYSIEVLPPLTAEELASLAQAQAARQSIDND